MHGIFTALPERAAEAHSVPVNVFRNRERYHLDTCNGTSTAGLYSIRADAWTKSLYAKDRLLEDAIPSYLLHDHIVQSNLLSQTQSYPADSRDISLPFHRRSTVTACHHDNRSLVVHAAGRNMGELILRDARHISNHIQGRLTSEPGFTIPLGTSPILQVDRAGCASFNSCSHILARTSSEVFHLRTVNVTDHIPIHPRTPKGDGTGPSGQGVEGVEVILEPMQRWTTPEELVAMAISSTSWSYAVFLSAKGTLLTWNPLGGLSQHSSEPVFRGIANMSHGRGAIDCTKTALLECTLHPQEYLAACGDELFRIDLRARRGGPVYTAASSISSLKQHSESHLYLLALTTGGVLFMDSRHTKKPLAERVVPQAHSALKYADVSTSDVPQGLYIGASSSSRLMYMHNIELSGVSEMRGMKGGGGGGQSAAGGLSTLLSGATPSGTKSALRWDVTGYPVIDRSSFQALWGFDYVPFKSERGRVESQLGEEEGGEGGGGGGRRDAREGREGRDDSAKERNLDRGFLIQQTSLGDVYAQLITLRGQRGAEGGEGNRGKGAHVVRMTSLSSERIPKNVPKIVSKNVPLVPLPLTTALKSAPSSSLNSEDRIRKRGSSDSDIEDPSTGSDGDSDGDSDGEVGIKKEKKEKREKGEEGRKREKMMKDGPLVSKQPEGSSDSEEEEEDEREEEDKEDEGEAMGNVKKVVVEDSESEEEEEEHSSKKKEFRGLIYKKERPSKPSVHPSIHSTAAHTGNSSSSSSSSSTSSSSSSVPFSSSSSSRTKSKSFLYRHLPQTTVQLGAPCGSCTRTLDPDSTVDVPNIPKKRNRKDPGPSRRKTRKQILHDDRLSQYALGSRLEADYCDRLSLKEECSTKYPLDSRTFLPFVDVNTMKGFDEVLMRPEDLRRDILLRRDKHGKRLLTRKSPPAIRDLKHLTSLLTTPLALGPASVLTMNASNISNSVNINGPAPTPTSALHDRLAQSGGMTLWEIQSFLRSILPGNILGVKVLRDFLLTRKNLRERLLPLGDLPVQGGREETEGMEEVPSSVDGLRVCTTQAIEKGLVKMKMKDGVTNISDVRNDSDVSGNGTDNRSERCHCFATEGTFVPSKSITRTTDRGTDKETDKRKDKGTDKRTDKGTDKGIWTADIPCSHPHCLVPYALFFSLRDTETPRNVSSNTRKQAQTGENMRNASDSRIAPTDPRSDVTPLVISMLLKSWK